MPWSFASGAVFSIWITPRLARKHPAAYETGVLVFRGCPSFAVNARHNLGRVSLGNHIAERVVRFALIDKQLHQTRLAGDAGHVDRIRLNVRLTVKVPLVLVRKLDSDTHHLFVAPWNTTRHLLVEFFGLVPLAPAVVADALLEVVSDERATSGTLGMV